MKRTLLALSVIAAILPLGVAARAQLGEELPNLPRPCTQDPGLPAEHAVERPADCQRILYRVGPLHVTPGDNLNLLGPITIEKPALPGWIVRFKPDLTLADGTVPPIDILHLHHSVWYREPLNKHEDTRFFNGGDPLFASGEEKTIINFPEGYGLRTTPQEAWLINFMIHNQTPQPDNIYITYELDFIPDTSVAAPGITEVKPMWSDVTRIGRYGTDYSIYQPVYNTQRVDSDGNRFGHIGADGKWECTFPRENCAEVSPFNEKIIGNGMDPGSYGPAYWNGYVRSAPAGKLVWMAGHLHPGGKRLDLELVRGSANNPANRRRIFTSDAQYWDASCIPNGTRKTVPNQDCPLSWDMAMESTPVDWPGIQMRGGDRIVMNSTYESELSSWYEGMGIMVGYYAPDPHTPGVDPFSNAWDPSIADAGTITHGPLDESKNWGGTNNNTPDWEDAFGWRTNYVGIAGFTYLPGGIGTSNQVIPEVVDGDQVTFANLDPQAAIYHTVTTCKVPCAGSTGLSFPLANGTKPSSNSRLIDFDSTQLGFGNLPANSRRPEPLPQPLHDWLKEGPPPPDALPQPVKDGWDEFRCGKNGNNCQGLPFYEPQPRLSIASDRASWTLDTRELAGPGEYSFFCRVHPFMRGVLRVVDH